MPETSSASTESIPVLVHAGGKTDRGTALAHVFNEKEKSSRAWRALGLCLALSVVSVIIPLAHFVLVPGFLLLSPAAFYWTKNQRGKLTGLEARCPFCRRPLASVGGGLNFPIRVVCAGCGEPVKMDPA